MFTSQHAGQREFSAITRLNAPQLQVVAVLQDDYDQPVRTIAFSPDSQTLVASTLDSITLWHVEKQQRLAHTKMSALHLAYSPDGATLALAGREIIFLDPRTGKTKLTMKGHRNGTTGIAFSADNQLFASGGMDGLVTIGSLATRRLIANFEHQSQVRGLAFSPDGETLATIAWGDPQSPRALYLWQIRTGRKLAEIKCHTEKNLVFSADGRYLAVDGLILDTNTLNERYDFKERMVAFSPDGALAATCRSDFNSIGLWDMHTGEQINLLKDHTQGIWSIAFSPDGRWLASSSGKLDTRAILKGADQASSSDNTVRLWGVELEDTRPLRRVTGRLQSLPGKTKLLKRL